jgi:membrane protein implicated in regulation of membrane protease activity
MLWWYWMLLGLGLLVGEMLIPGGLFALFFGLAALLIGVMVGIGVKAPNWLQWLFFSVLSIASLLLFRGPVLARLKIGQQATPRLDTLVGEIVTLRDDLPPGAIGKAELRGTVWTVQNGAVAALHRGQRCRVQRVDGLTLRIEAIEQQGEAT